MAKNKNYKLRCDGRYEGWMAAKMAGWMADTMAGCMAAWMGG